MVLSKTDKIILYSVLGIVPVGLTFFMLFSFIFCPSTKQMLTDMYASEHVSGVVDSMYNDENNHNVRTLVLTNKSLFQIEELWTYKIDIGDSLYKKRGSFRLEVFKKDGKEIVLNYKEFVPKD